MIHAGKEERSLSAEPSRRESGGEGGGGLGVDSSARRFPKACQVDFLPLPARTPAPRSPHVVRFFSQLLVSIITPRQSERSRDK